jgi:hypothetical protein
MREGFSIKAEYHFYIDENGQQKYTSSRSRNLNSKLKLKNRLALVIEMFDLVWDLK